MITWKKAALMAAAALTSTVAMAATGGFDKYGQWNPELLDDADRPAASWKNPPKPKEGEEDAYKSYTFVPSTIKINGKLEKVAKYQGWTGWTATSGDYHFFKPQGKRKFWWMFSEGNPAFNGLLYCKSYLLLEEVDCFERSYRPIQYSEYKYIMGEGQPHSSTSFQFGNWKYPTPGSIMDIWLNHFCSRR